MPGSAELHLKPTYNFLVCNAFIYPFRTLFHGKTKSALFSSFFTLRMFLSHYFLKTDLFISDTFLRRINIRRITQHSFQRHLHARVTFFVFFSHTFRKVSTCFEITRFFFTRMFSVIRFPQGEHRESKGYKEIWNVGEGKGLKKGLIFQRVKS